MASIRSVRSISLNNSFSEELDDFRSESNDLCWQSATSNISQRMNYMYYTKEFSDLLVELEDNEFAKVHRIVLAMHSPVFETMFYGSLPIKYDKITLHGVNSKTFYWILSYMYLGRISFTDINLSIQVYRIAHEKQMDIVVLRCSKFLCTKITTENALMILEMAQLYEDKALKYAAIKKIFQKRGSLFTSTDMLEVSKPVLLDLISGNEFHCSEKAVFRTVLSWSVNKLQKENAQVTSTSIREKMNDFLPHIHFLMMSFDFFLTEVLASEILTPDESISIMKRMNGMDAEVPSFVSTENVVRFFSEDTSLIHRLTMISYPQCNMTFIYNHMYDTYSDNLIAFKASENLFLSSIKVKPNCYTGTWQIQIFSNQREIGTSSNCTSPWCFGVLIPIVADKPYICKVIGKGKRSKHKLIDFEASTTGITFTGVAVACNISIEFLT